MKSIIRMLVCSGVMSVMSESRSEYTVHSWEYEHECTSWIVFSDLTKNNANLLHKNRDASPRDIFIQISPKDSPRRWLGMGDYTSKSVNSGINASGLAVGLNSGEKCTDNSRNPKGKTTPAIVRVILETCDTAAQAVAKLQELIAAEDYFHGDKGSIFLFMDIEEAYIAEMTAHFCTVQKYEHGYAYRANIWHNPDMAAYTNNTPSAFLNSANRELTVRTVLNAALKEHGKIRMEDVLMLSRFNRLDKSVIERCVCSKTTNSASSFEIDKEFPGTLSTGYMLIGHPRHTICVPVPICVNTVDERIATPVWAHADLKRFKELGPDAEIPQEWLTYEKMALKAYAETREEARKAMRQGRTKDAESMLNKKAQEILDGAAALLGL